MHEDSRSTEENSTNRPNYRNLIVNKMNSANYCGKIAIETMSQVAIKKIN